MITNTMPLPVEYIEGKAGDMWILAGNRVVMYITPQGKTVFSKDVVALDPNIPPLPKSDDTSN